MSFSASGTVNISSYDKPPLNEKLYRLEGEELGFFQAQTGIRDEEALKQHILRVQAEAYNTCPYTCIMSFWFLDLHILQSPAAYQHMLKLGRERKNAILLDIGCCFGNDIRKAIADGYPLKNVITSDLVQDFWGLGHKLFKTTKETFPVPFLPGDIFDSALLELTSPIYTPLDTPPPSLPTLTSLTPLNGHVSAIHLSAVFHLFDETKQLELARRLAGLLSPLPGSIIFGIHLGLKEKGIITTSGGLTMFAHSPESWKELWDDIVFQKGSVRVDAELQDIEERTAAAVKNAESHRDKYYWLVWSVTRL